MKGGIAMHNPTLWQVLLSLSIDVASLLDAAKQQLTLYLRRYQTRHQLSKLTPEQLQDVGITPEQAAEEIDKPFWH